jgi:regulator of RNase E activity RraA
VADTDETRAAVARLRRLRTAVLSDCLDALGAEGCVVDPSVRPLHPDWVLAGVARPARAARAPGKPARPYLGWVRLTDSLRPGDVVVLTADRDPVAALWGDLLATAAKARGAAGLVADGAIRDRRQILELGFPSFAAALTPADNYGRLDLVELDVPIECAGAPVAPGDLVLADCDGVVIVPRALAAEAIRLAEEQSAGEMELRAALASGVTVETLFTERGIL